MAHKAKKNPGKTINRIDPVPGWEGLLKSLPRNSTSEARAGFADALDASRTKKKRRILSRYGQDVAAVVPLEDVALLELLSKPKHRKVLRALTEELKKM
ncbi:MAG TPA: hypothetical protein PK109_01955 [Candidatus Paceibacterota bacterium]|nr:hypothetical protein [Candidatus Paceibacterota bacterium]